MGNDDNVIRAGTWPNRSSNEDANPAGEVDEVVRDAPVSAAQTLAEDAARGGGTFDPGPEYKGSFGRTLFDDRASEDGSVTVVFPADRIGDVPSQSLVRIHSVPDAHEYIATVTSGPFCEPDGLTAQSPQLIATAVSGFKTLPRHHGRFQATILGEKTDKGIVPARRRPRPNSAVHLVADDAVADILNLKGDMRLGLLNGHEDVPVMIDTRKKAVLPRHSANIGTTGGGKSTGVGRTICELQKAGTCVIVFDVEGEYTSLNKPTDSPEMTAVLEERGLRPEPVDNTHVYRLHGTTSTNAIHPSSHQFSLSFDMISPFAFGEIMELSDAQNERLFQAYEIARALLFEMGIFPNKDNHKHQEMVLDIDEFDRGWPMMRLADLQYLVAAIINIGDKREDPQPLGPRESQFFHDWERVQRKIGSFFGATNKTSGITALQSWKALSSRVGKLRRLKIFDLGQKYSIDYAEMLQPGRVSIVDLSDVENMEVRNLTIAEMLRGILNQQQCVYDETAKAREEGEQREPLMTNVIIEEAHEFLSARRVTKMPTLRDQLMKIAKRGRKRYLGLTFVTQSPNDLPDDVLGLVNNWVIYKIDEATIRRLKSYVPNSDESLWNLVRGLGPGQALVSFTHMKRPVICAVDPSPARLLMAE